MKHLRTVTAQMCIDRPSGEIEVTLTGNYYRGRRGTKAHPMDRFAEPDEEPEIEYIHAATPAGEIGLTDAEIETAQEKLMEAAAEEADNDRAGAADAHEDRMREERE